MVSEATALGAELAHMGIGLAVFYIAYRLGMWTYIRSKRIWAGWIVGLLFLIPAGALIGPLLNGLDAEKCRAADIPSDCMSGPSEN
jgi:hypothetical protein